MNFKEAYKEMLKGKKVRRPGWGGYWFIEDDKIKIHLKDGNTIFDNFTQETMTNTLEEDWEVVEESKVWKPKEGELYYAVDYDGTILNFGVCENENVADYDEINLGNCFKTQEEAKHMAEKLRVIKELRDFALENNGAEIDWENGDQEKHIIAYGFQTIKTDLWYRTQHIPFNIYFTSEDIAQKAIETIGEDRIKKYYFDIDEENSK